MPPATNFTECSFGFIPNELVQMRLQLLVDISTAERDQEFSLRYLICAKLDG